jgi:hypothetical protein
MERRPFDMNILINEAKYDKNIHIDEVGFDTIILINVTRRSTT